MFACSNAGTGSGRLRIPADLFRVSMNAIWLNERARLVEVSR